MGHSGKCYAELLRAVEITPPRAALGHRLYSMLAQSMANVRGGRTRLLQDVLALIRHSGPPV